MLGDRHPKVTSRFSFESSVSNMQQLGWRRLWIETLEFRRLLAVVTVDTELDVVDPTDGVTSLREAIFATNAMPGPDEVVFDFGHDGPATILLEQGEVEISEAVTIAGDGPSLLTIDAQEQSRIFNITAETGDFAVRGLTLTRGKLLGDGTKTIPDFDGGAIRSLTTGNLSIEQSVLTGNGTENYSPSVMIKQISHGGAVFARVPVIITSSDVSNNSTNVGARSFFCAA